MTQSQTLLLAGLVFSTVLSAEAQPPGPGSCYRNVIDDSHKLFMVNADHKLKDDSVRYICFEDDMRVEFVDYYRSVGIILDIKNVSRMYFTRDDARKASIKGDQVMFEIKGVMPPNPTILSMNSRLVFRGKSQGSSIEGSASIVGMVMDIKKMMDPKASYSDFGDKELETSAIRLELETDKETLAAIRLKK